MNFVCYKETLSYISALIISLFIALPSIPASGKGLTGSDSFSIKDMVLAGYEHNREGRSEDALRHYISAASRYSSDKDSTDRYNAVIGMNNAGYTYLFYRHNPELAYHWLAKARRTAENDGFTILLPGIYDNIAKVHRDCGDPETALEILRKAFAMSANEENDVNSEKALTNYRLRLMVFNDLVALCVEHRMLPAIKKEIREMRTTGFPQMPLAGYSQGLCRALICLDEGSPGEAFSILNECLTALDPQTDSLRYLVNHRAFTAMAASEADDTALALELLDKALAETEAGGLDDLAPWLLNEKARILPDSAVTLRLKAYEIRDSLFNTRSLVRIKDLEKAEEMDEISRKAAVLEESHRQHLILLYTMGGALAVICALTGGLAVRNSRLRKANKAMVHTRMMAEREKELVKIADAHLSRPDNEEKSGNRKAIAEKAKEIMEKDREIFSPEFSLERLAEMMEVKPKELSSAINEVFGVNLSSLLAEARVREACRLLSDPATYPAMTLDAIALNVGYRSRPHFCTVFKKSTGMSPSRWASYASDHQSDKRSET